jgi:quinol monooxygenase YgiN
MSELIEATAFISPAPGRIDELRERLRAVVAGPWRTGLPGVPGVRAGRPPGHFVLWERFADSAALEVHMAAEWTREYFASGAAAHTECTRCAPCRRPARWGAA